MNKVQTKIILGNIFLILLIAVCPAVSAYLYGKSFRNIFLCTIISFIFGIILITLFRKETKKFSGYAFSFLYGLACTCLFPLLPVDGWFVLPLALALVITLDVSSAIFIYTGLLSLCVFLDDASIIVFLIYLFTGFIVILLFNNLEREFNRVGIPFAMSIFIYSVALAGKVVFYSQGNISIDAFFIPIINLFLCFVLMLGVLRVYCAKVVDKEKGEYIDINDQEFPLLAKYKEEDDNIYYNAIHSAYFSEKIARLLNMDIDLAKNGGYYHKIIANECNKHGKKLEDICHEYKFPSKAITLLEEYNYKSVPIKMKETAVVYLVDAVISSILFLQEKDGNAQLDYGQISKALIDRKKDSGILNECELTFKDLEEIKKVFIGEKLYYDFLRRK